ncbi:MAG: TIGR03936 family radical SAM-associated protein [Oscillospiraceae bacterium]
MNKHRLHFSKQGRASYISHLDLMRTFQRAFLRAELNIKQTEGFNPHSFVSIPLPLSVGFSSDCEILDFELLGDVDLAEVPARMNAVLPEGIIVHRCYVAVRPIKQLSFVDCDLTLDYEKGVPTDAQKTITELLSREHWEITKKSSKAKSGFTTVDIAPLVKEYSFTESERQLVLHAKLSAQSPGLNPQLLWTSLTAECPALTADYTHFHRNAVLDAELKPFA